MYRKTFLTIIKQLGKISASYLWHSAESNLKFQMFIFKIAPAYSRRNIVVEHKELAQSIANTSI